jgi:acyl-coenzyme A thioesterase PaaI-like protein
MEIEAGWETARGSHGGYVMSLLARAMEEAAGRQPRSITVHFLRPPKLGPVTASTTIERHGRSMTTVTGRLEQDGKPVALGLGAFAGPYAGPTLGEWPMPDVAPPGHAPEPIPGAPPFAQRLAMQPRFGDAPFTHSASDEVGGWIDLREPGPLDGPTLCMLADAWFPAVWPRLGELHPAPTIDLTVHFRAAVPVDGPLLARFRSREVRDGYFEEDGELWTRAGELVVISRQLALLMG